MTVMLRRLLIDSQVGCYYPNEPLNLGLRVFGEVTKLINDGGCSGVAPCPPRLQRGALLRELSNPS